MKSKVSGILVALCAAAPVWAQEGRVPEIERLRIGVVDLAKVFNGYDKRSVREQEFKAQEATLKARYEEKQEAIRRLRGELDLLRAGSPTYMDKQEALAGATAELRFFEKAQQDLLKSRFETYILEILREIEEVVQEIGQAGRYHLIIKVDDPAKSGEETTPLELRAVLFYGEEIDISDQVLARLNERFREAGKE